MIYLPAMQRDLYIPDPRNLWFQTCQGRLKRDLWGRNSNATTINIIDDICGLSDFDLHPSACDEPVPTDKCL